MKKYIPVLKRTSLFRGVSEAEILSMLECLGAALKSYQKGETLIRQGEYLSDIMVLVEGKIHIQRDDYWGNSNLINIVEVGEIFGEAYAAPNSGAMVNNVIAAADSSVIFLNAQKVITTCPSACKFHSLVVQNLIFAISQKNRKLMRKLCYLSNRTTREKLMSYLSEESGRQNSLTFTIPFNRQELADFLSVNRSAMSRELCKMRDEGLIRFERNRFTLI
ncbi:MAG: Crp/Fnr family transcriptional regulator [Clostridiales bacterium]|nr:Crp/Fnr family transcriptional regulator [Clostridiales bacterium]